MYLIFTSLIHINALLVIEKFPSEDDLDHHLLVVHDDHSFTDYDYDYD